MSDIKSQACGAEKHEDCDRLAWAGNEVDAVYCCCDCGCDGIGQDALV